MTITDSSNDKSLEILFYKDGNPVGEIIDYDMDPASVPGIFSQGVNKTIAGNLANEYTDSSTIGAYIPMGKSGIGHITGVSLDFDLPYSSDYQMIANSLKIKKIPSH